MEPLRPRFSKEEAEEILKKTTLSDGSKPTGQKRKELKDILMGLKSVGA